MSKEETVTVKEEKNVAPASIFKSKVADNWIKTDEQYPLIEFSKKGQVLECVFRSARSITTENGESFLWDVTVNNEMFSLWSSTVLESQRARLGIEEGMLIAIEYNGIVQNKRGGRKYKSFSIYLPGE